MLNLIGRATITVEEAGRILGISRSAAYRAANAGQIPTIRVGRRLLVPTAKFCEMLGLSIEDIMDRLAPADLAA